MLKSKLKLFVVGSLLAVSITAGAVAVGDIGWIRIHGTAGAIACDGLEYQTGLELTSGDCDIEVNTYSCVWQQACENCQYYECRCLSLVTAAGPGCGGVHGGFHQ